LYKYIWVIVWHHIAQMAQFNKSVK